ncbi:transglutaminaseTgpA domain-containing protein [Bifidobacterium simiiventris]|nr:transglutaminaseTgpA domain-containing protein [Bifidobacterium simiiventris]MBW3078570.1 DUF58 domain-containing protein [Bifidobacterium simiiventris]
MGLLLDDRALMAAAVAVAVTFGCSLILAVTQWRLVGRYGVALIDERRGLVDVPQSAPRLARVLLPRAMRVRSQYERLDQDGGVVARMVGDIGSSRGLYRRAAIFARWHDPFGLWSASRLLPDRDERIVLPDVPTQPASGQRMADQRLQGLTQSENTGGVRAYTPGDPPKLISWKATAHRGELMTRETGRDIRVSTIVMLDARSAGITDAQIDAQVEQVLPLLESTSMDCRLIVTDGIRFADDAEDCARLLAAMSPISTDGSVTADDAARQTQPDKTQDSAATDVAATDAPQMGAAPDRLAAHVAEIAMRQTGAVGVRLLTPHPQGELATALRQAVGTDHLRVIETAAAPVIPERKIARLASLARNDRGRAVASVRNDKRTALVSRALTAAALLVFCELSVVSLTGLVAATGYWPWFALAALAVVAVESNVPSRSRLRYAVRAASVIIATLVAAVTLVVVRIHDITQLWLFDSAAFRRVNAEAATLAARNATGTVTSVQRVTPLGVVRDVFERGFDSLDSQLPPLTVDEYGDIILILAVAVVVIVIRLILVARRTAPAFAVLPVIVLASNYALIGRQTDWWQIALIIPMFLIALWQTRPERTFAPTPAAVTALVTAVTLALTTPAVSLAEAVPMSFGDSTGLLSANTINPMVDLKRSLQAGSDSIVLTYRATKRTYLRMTTLDGFNGDTWSFDEALAKDANLYGSGIQLGLDSSNMMSDDDRYRNADDPLSYYLYMGYLGMYGSTADSAGTGAIGSYEYDPTGSGYGAGSGSGVGVGAGSGSGASDGGEAAMFFGSSEYTDMASITIETLSSRFLPVPGVTNSLMNGIGGLGSDWDQAGSTIYSRMATTTQDMHYRALGIGLQPISSTSGFTRIGDVHDIQQQIEKTAQDNTVPWSQRTAAREQAIEDGLAERHGQWLVMPLEVHSSGTAANVAEVGDSVTDKQGNPVASVSGISGYIGRNGATPTPTYSLELSDSFLTDYGIGSDETVGIMFSEGGGIALAMTVDEPDNTEADADSSSDDDVQAGDADGALDGGANTIEGRSTMRWRELIQLYKELGYEMLSSSSNAPRQAEYARSALSTVQAMDRNTASNYRTLPDDLPANVTALVKQAKADGVATDGDGYDHQIAAMRWLVDYFTDPANGFVYSLNSPDGNGRSNLDVINSFLDSKSGYCTHYASALAVLGRAMGVPTRMVMGYNAGVEKANADGEFEVAAKQLHAWVDAYIDGVGWVPFDVTPATVDNGSASQDGTTSAGATGSAGDSVTTTITPDSTGADTNGGGADATDPNASDTQDDTNADGSQSGTTQQSGSAVTGAQQARPWWNRLELPKWLAIALWVVLGVTVLAGLAAVPSIVRALRRRRRLRLIAGIGAVSDSGRNAGDDGDARAWLAAWSEICDTAWDAGIRWRPSDTERAIAERIADAIGTAQPLTGIADQATAIAFGVSPQPVASAGGLHESVIAVLADLKTVRNRLPIHIRAKFLLLPPSLFHR